MKKYLGSYLSQSDVQNALDNGTLKKPYVAAINNVTVDFDGAAPDYTKKPLTFEILTGGSITYKNTVNTNDGIRPIEFSKDNGLNWTLINKDNTPVATDGYTIEVSAGDNLMFRGDNDNYYSNGNFNMTKFEPVNGAKFNVIGNIMSLLNSTGFSADTTLWAERNKHQYAFGRLFEDNNGIVSAENLKLPATSLSGASNCYMYMFKGSSLTKAPELPATTLANYCYNAMFSGCTSLTTSPSILPGMELFQYCYSSMFRGCTSLTTAPVLPATTLVYNCYYHMFEECTSLTTAPELPATTLLNFCYENMFYNCTSLTTPPSILPVTNLSGLSGCYQGMFWGCTSLTTAPELPATTLGSSCYNKMFMGCSSLVTPPELPTTTLTTLCYSEMFFGCTSLTTAPELPATTLAESCYSGMFNRCTLLNYIKCLATDISASGCTTSWIERVSSSGTFVKAIGTDWSGKSSSSGIPSGWTVVEE